MLLLPYSEGSTISQEIHYRRYEPGEEAEIVEFLDLVFNGWPKFNVDAIEHWRWKYLENPIKINLNTVALSGEKIVGCYHEVPLYIKIGENIHLSSNDVDVAVHPDYRQRGIYNELRKEAVKVDKIEGIDFNFGVSNVPIIVATNVKRGDMVLPSKPIVYVKIDDLALHEKFTQKTPLIKQIGYHIAKTVNRYTPKKTLNNTYTISETKRFNYKIDEFWKNILTHHNFLVNRSKEYMNWRYTHKDAPEYRILQATSEGEKKGYGVYYINRYEEDYPVGYIVDLLHTPGEADASYEIMEKIDAYFEEENVNIVKWQIPEGNAMSQIANDYNYLNSRSQNMITFSEDRTRIGNDLHLLLQSHADKIHFAYGDFDWI